MSQLHRLRRRLRLRPFLRPLSRREVLRAATAAAGLAVTGPLFAAAATSLVRANAPKRTAVETPFLHGVASGDPLSDRVILWTRVTPLAMEDIAVTVRVYRDTALTDLLGSANAAASAARDWTVKIDFTGLAPATTYYYRFEAQGFGSAVGRTRTLPVGATERVRLGVVSCSNYPAGFFNAYGFLAQRADLDAVLHLGDYLYEGGGGSGERAHVPPNEIISLADYRERHGQYRGDADLQAMTRQHPFITVWDDHESTNDSWRDGAENHTEGAEGMWPQRKAWAQQAYDEWMPIRLPEPGNAARIWREFRFGDLLDLVMLDTRLFDRDEQLGTPPPPNADIAAADRRLIGPEQRQFLLDALSRPGATWKVIGQQVMFGQLKVVGTPLAVNNGGQYLNGDQWDGYQAERMAIFDHLRDNAINNTVVLTGDIHTSWAMDLTPDPNNPVELAGGYNPVTGGGSLGVEFVGTSVTSSGLPELADVQDLIRVNNPHIKYVDLELKGYLLVDITPTRTTGEWWYVSTIAERGGTESFGTAYPCEVDSNRLGAATTATEPKADAPALAPDTAPPVATPSPTPSPSPSPVPAPSPVIGPPSVTPVAAEGRFGGGAASLALLAGLGAAVALRDRSTQ